MPQYLAMKANQAMGITEDEKFAVAELKKKLEEEMNFKLWLPLRDANPGTRMYIQALKFKSRIRITIKLDADL